MRLGLETATDHEHVRYLPWKGSSFGRDSIFGLKVLIVGESHYSWPGCVDDETLTRRVFGERAAGEVYSFNSKIASALLGKPDLTLDEYQSCWNSVAFYNYILELLPDAKTRPTPAAFADPKAFLAFKEIISDLMPDCVLMFAKVAFDYMPAYDFVDPGAKDYVGCEAGWYNTGTGAALTVGLVHPSAWSRLGTNSQMCNRFVARALAYAAKGPPEKIIPALN